MTVLIDYQNAHLSAHNYWCGLGEQLPDCLIDPRKLADKLIEKRAPGGELEAVHVYRGRPDHRREATLASYNDKHRAVWQRDPLVHVHRRDLKYPADFGKPECYERPREKGIDVWLAVDLATMALKGQYEVAIVFSRDEDLIPALEIAFDAPGTHTEVATWLGLSRLSLPYRKLYCHFLDENDFHDVRDTTVY